MRENRLSGLEGGVAHQGHPYPYESRERSDAASTERGLQSAGPCPAKGVSGVPGPWFAATVLRDKSRAP